MGEMTMATRRPRRRSLAHLVPKHPKLTSRSIDVSLGVERRTSGRWVEALVIDNWALHPCLYRDWNDEDADRANVFTVTYVPLGIGIPHFAGGIPIGDAVDIVAALAAHVPELEILHGLTMVGDSASLLLAIVAEIIGESGR